MLQCTVGSVNTKASVGLAMLPALNTTKKDLRSIMRT